MSDAPALADPRKIVAYHAHIYYDVGNTKDAAIDDYTDHATHAIWFGEKLPLRLEMLRQ